MPGTAETLSARECRPCCTFCDRVVLPSGCGGCPYLYAYDDEATGRRYMGCLNRVFKVEIDVEMFEQAERTRYGYGGVKMTGRPIPRCRTSVERAYYGDGQAFDCVNPAFFLPPEPGADASTAFDLRDRL